MKYVIIKLVIVALILSTWGILGTILIWGHNAVSADVSAVPESYRTKVTLTATGSDGAASGSVTSGYLRGYLKAIYIDYGASITSTTDITVALTNPTGTVMVKSNSVTDTWYYPAIELTDSAGSGLSAYSKFPIDDYLTISAGQSTSGTVAAITIEYGD